MSREKVRHVIYFSRYNYQVIVIVVRVKGKINVRRIGINELDQACIEHDIFFKKHKNTKPRHQASMS